jgi:hypothetical protein
MVEELWKNSSRNVPAFLSGRFILDSRSPQVSKTKKTGDPQEGHPLVKELSVG